MKKEIANLVRIADNRSSRGRANLYTGIADVLNDKDEKLTLSETELMCDIMRRITHEVEMTIRIKLAQTLALDPEVSESLITLLANDEIEVAYPVLRNNPVLRDSDLIDIIQKKALEHHMAIALRKQVGASVSYALANTGQADLAVTLLENAGANIDEQTFALIVQMSRTEEKLQKPLITHRDLPKHLAMKMYEFVSAALKSYVEQRFDIAPETLDSALNLTIERLVANADHWEEEDRSTDEAMINKLAEAGALKRTFLIKSLNHGNTRQFELAFSRMLDLEEKSMLRLIYHSGTQALALACVAVELDRSVFPTIFRLTRFAKRMVTTLTDADKEVLQATYQDYDRQTALAALLKHAEMPLSA